MSGLIVHYLSAFAITLLATFLRPFIWLAIYGPPYISPVDPIDPSSGEGTVMQLLGMLSYVPTGFFAMRWGGNSGTKALLVLLAYAAIFSSIATIQHINDMSFLHILWYWLSSPLGLAIGLAIHQYRIINLPQTINR
jgi:hypothetical protein